MAAQRTRARSCPNCSSKQVAPFMYGYPSNMDEAFKAEKAGELVIGGCVIQEDSPAWRCLACRHEWGKLGG